MFVDIVKIEVTAGKGGNGSVSFHREKFVAAGGPDGGDGGRGGDVIFAVDPHMSTLMDLRYKKKYAAQNGGDGSGNKRSGKSGEHLIIKVPRGTIIKDASTGLAVCDLSEDDSRFIAARGGSGGYGNAHFATPTRQAPQFAKPGRPGRTREVVLELKLIADVGLIGFPSVGKSTLLSVLTKARPKIADYHFTTLAPNLGVAEVYGDKIVIADIPGIIEGASEGVGLGLDFLRHIERTRLLVHLVDISMSEGRDALEDFATINAELANYSPVLARKPQIVAAAKVDITREHVQSFTDEITARGYQCISISAVTHEGVAQLLEMCHKRLQEIPATEIEIHAEQDLFENQNALQYDVTVDGDVYYIEGAWAQRLVDSVNFGNNESLNYFQRSLRKRGVIDRLESMGINENDTVCVCGMEFVYNK